MPWYRLQLKIRKKVGSTSLYCKGAKNIWSRHCSPCGTDSSSGMDSQPCYLHDMRWRLGGILHARILKQSSNLKMIDHNSFFLFLTKHLQLLVCEAK